MKRVLSLVLCLFITLSMIISFSVYADTLYTVAPSDYELLETINNSNYYYKNDTSGSEIRTIQFYKNNSYYQYAVSLTYNALMRFKKDNTSNGVRCNNSVTVNNVVYYVGSWSTGQNDIALYSLQAYRDKYGYTVPDSNIGNEYEQAVYYTYGQGGETVLYGDLIDVGFYTNFTNSQQSTFSAMKNNKDTIKWNGYQDSLGNAINQIGFTVDIQAAIVDYEANTKSDLLNQTISDMITGDWTDLISISPNVGEVNFTWENVAQTLLSTNYNLDFWNKLSIFQSYNQQSQLKFMKEGWIYRIRLRNTVDDYVGDWQIVYTLQGAPAGISDGTIQHIYNTNTTIPEQTVYNDCDEINNLNNTTNNWYFNDNPMDVTNDNETWVEKLIKFIIGVVDKIAGLIDKLINIILDVFGSILDGLIDLIMSLFGDLDLKDLFFGWFSDLKDYIESIDLTLPVFNLPEMTQVESFNRLVQETMNIFINNNLGFVIFIPLILLIVRLVL